MTAIDDFSEDLSGDESNLIEHPDRREFLGLALGAAGGIVLSPLFPRMAWAQNGASCPAPFNEDLLPVGEIKSVNGFLRGIVDTQYELRKVIEYNGTLAAPAYKCREHPLRTYHGYQGFGEMKKPVTKIGSVESEPPSFGQLANRAGVKTRCSASNRAVIAASSKGASLCFSRLPSRKFSKASS